MDLYELGVILPILALVAAALAIMVADWFLPRGDVRPHALLSLIGLAAAGYYTLTGWRAAGLGRAAFKRGVPLEEGSLAIFQIQADRFGLYICGILVLTAFLSVLLSIDYVKRHPGLARAEYFVILLLATAAMMVTALAGDLILLFLAIETFSIALYILSGFLRDLRGSQEAALKYFILGAFAAGFLLYGIALVYGAAGTTNLHLLQVVLAEAAPTPMLLAGLALILVGLGFKIAMAPFHQWTPDVYEGAPTTVTAFMSAGTKAAAFTALIRVLWSAFGAMAADWAPLLAALAVVTMLVGNLVALVQSDLKRMLAYSAVAHAGYLMVALVAGGPEGHSATLYYLLMYALMNLGAFGALLAVGPVGPEGRDATQLNDLQGLAKRQPMLALALAIFLFSLTGLPPMAGFVGKWYVFQAAVGAGYAWLASVMVVASVISAFYYLRPIVLMYMAEPVEEGAPEVGSPTAIAVGVSALVIVSALLLSSPLISAARASALGGPIVVSEIEDADGDGFGEGRMFMPAPSELDERMKDKADNAADNEAADEEAADDQATGSDAP